MDVELKKIKVEIPAGAVKKTLFQIAKARFEYGKHYLIQGPSGRGKTTLLHLIAGLFTPSEGEVKVGEANLHSMSDGERAAFRRRNVGMIFQKLNLLEHLTASENVELGLVAGASGLSAAAALKKVNLEGFDDKISSVLSLGEQQRVAVARVLAQDAKLLLADEPTSSLDAKNTDLVVTELLEAARGKTLIVVSHDERLRGHFREHIDFQDLVR